MIERERNQSIAGVFKNDQRQEIVDTEMADNKSGYCGGTWR